MVAKLYGLACWILIAACASQAAEPGARAARVVLDTAPAAETSTLLTLAVGLVVPLIMRRSRKFLGL
ncbi:hypothetical protein [Paludibacterium purpuratum]|uniref:Secreted protein with PEP-CTERM sorting signal n=1 Tax=Paludibacterium purpuratum TaxID=1144873 RepID=A0A4R7B4X8_9NEIS|nr:hypothetical protein [Paludibacterium purpuratum]TDR77825.1 hypothetical protein DFP86_10965 [Paludibacterium purpuratum]